MEATPSPTPRSLIVSNDRHELRCLADAVAERTAQFLKLAPADLVLRLDEGLVNERGWTLEARQVPVNRA
jgi:hypothetical protein